MMNTKDLIEAAKFQATVKPHDEFIVEVAKQLETLYEENNRQKAEIERLTNKVEELSEVLSDTIRIRYAEAKTEAVKEFAERLKNESAFECDVSLGYGRPCYEDAIPIIAIDNLVKEMVGDVE